MSSNIMCLSSNAALLINDYISRLYHLQLEQLQTTESFIKRLIYQLRTEIDLVPFQSYFKDFDRRLKLMEVWKELDVWCRQIFAIYFAPNQLPRLYYLIGNRDMKAIQSYLFNSSNGCNIVQRWECLKWKRSPPELEIFYLTNFIRKHCEPVQQQYIGKGIDADFYRIFTSLIDHHALNNRNIDLSFADNGALVIILIHLMAETNVLESKYIFKKYWHKIKKLIEKYPYLGPDNDSLNNKLFDITLYFLQNHSISKQGDNQIQNHSISKQCDNKTDLRLCKNLKRYFMNKSRFYTMMNIIKLRQCNYMKCRRFDLKGLKACKRCKSVFYCNRRHQKLHWKTHKNNCFENDARDYSLIMKYHEYVQTFKKEHEEKDAFDINGSILK